MRGPDLRPLCLISLLVLTAAFAGDAVAQSRALKDGKLKCYWTSTTNNMQAGPNINGEILPGWRNPATFVVVSDVYPTVSALAADLILPSAMWVEKEGAFGNAERRTQFWRQMIKGPGEAKSDLWQYLEFAKRFRELSLGYLQRRVQLKSTKLAHPRFVIGNHFW